MKAAHDVPEALENTLWWIRRHVQRVRDVSHQLAQEFRGSTDVTDVGDMDAVLIEAVGANRMDVVSALLDRGANIAATDEDGRPALVIAARRGFPGMVFLLLQRGAAERVIDHALAHAAFEGHPETVQVLLNGGASPAARRIVEKHADKFAGGAKTKELLIDFRVNQERDVLRWAAGVSDQEPTPPARRRL